MTAPGRPSTVIDDAALAAALFAVDPAGTGGIAVRSFAGPVRDAWLALVRELLPPGTPIRRVPVHIGDGRLLGGLDLSATLASGRPIAERGALAEADRGVVLLAMAERVPLATASHVAKALDTGEVRVERDGFALRHPARIGVVALDEGLDDERPPEALLDRLAFHVDLDEVGIRDALLPGHSSDEVMAARARLPEVEPDERVLEALCGTALLLDIASLRAPLLALRVARTVAALEGRRTMIDADAELAARLVLAPRATRLPAPEPAAEPEPDRDRPPDPSCDGERSDEALSGERPLEDLVLEAARAAIPKELLAELRLQEAGRARSPAPGRAGVLRKAMVRGRPAGVRRGEPRAGARLNVIETLRAAAPWQPLRRPANGGASARIEIRQDDFRITRFKDRSRTTVIFAVDASGSAALHRLAEAKGAVELLLADCYVRRDQVAVLAFRGRGADLLLPPTRSLVRAKRSLQGLPGGGGTPLAAGIDAAWMLADASRRRGDTPVVVLLTDGRANIARGGAAGRAQAESDAQRAAKRLRHERLAAILIDLSPRPRAEARALAEAMGALYRPLPHADAKALSATVRGAALGTSVRATGPSAA